MINILGPYIAGLIEGDGSIITPSSFRNNKNKINYPYIRICFNIKDINLADFLKNLIGGTINKNKTKTYCLLTIQKHENLIDLINLTNGYYRTPKYEAFRKLIIYLNDNYYLNIIVKNLDNSSIGSNSWLTGFSDADCNFNLTISKRKNTNNIRIMLSFRIEVTQNKTYDNKNYSFYPICLKISDYFNISLYTRKRINKNKEFYAYLVIAHNMSSHLLICKYFNEYPLLSSKYLNFKDWELIVNMQKTKTHLTPEGQKISKNIKLKFNNKRLIFNWNHLDINFKKLLNKVA